MDILTGLAYLHNKDLAHLDLKPSNVVVTSEDRCKLCDFGSCLQVQPRIDISVVNDMRVQYFIFLKACCL